MYIMHGSTSPLQAKRVDMHRVTKQRQVPSNLQSLTNNMLALHYWTHTNVNMRKISPFPNLFFV